MKRDGASAFNEAQPDYITSKKLSLLRQENGTQRKPCLSKYSRVQRKLKPRTVEKARLASRNKFEEIVEFQLLKKYENFRLTTTVSLLPTGKWPLRANDPLPPYYEPKQERYRKKGFCTDTQGGSESPRAFPSAPDAHGVPQRHVAPLPQRWGPRKSTSRSLPRRYPTVRARRPSVRPVFKDFARRLSAVSRGTSIGSPGVPAPFNRAASTSASLPPPPYHPLTINARSLADLDPARIASAREPYTGATGPLARSSPLRTLLHCSCWHSYLTSLPLLDARNSTKDRSKSLTEIRTRCAWGIERAPKDKLLKFFG